MNTLVEKLGKKLNLKEHRVGFGKKKQSVYGPGDIGIFSCYSSHVLLVPNRKPLLSFSLIILEGHKAKDGRLYLLDLGIDNFICLSIYRLIIL